MPAPGARGGGSPQRGSPRLRVPRIRPGSSTNPDQTFICGASGTINGSLVAYLTVAGTDTTSAKSRCSSLEGAAGCVAITTIPAGEYESVPECYVTLGGGVITAYIYTPKGGSDAETKVLCDTLLAGSTLPTLTP